MINKHNKLIVFKIDIKVNENSSYDKLFKMHIWDKYI